MYETTKDLKAKRSRLVYEAKQILNDAKKENRDLTAAESRQFDQLHAEVGTLADAIDNSSDGPRSVERGWQPGDTEAAVVAGPTLTRSQSFASHVIENDAEAREQAERFTREGVTLGAMLRAMITGPKNDAERRALSEGTDSAGGFTVPTIIAASFIDRLRKQMRVIQSGAKTVKLDESYKQNLARIATDTVPAWRAEAGSVAETDPVFDNLPFVAKSLANLTKVSRELFQDSVNIEELLVRSITQSFALELDRVALLGSGASNQPTGIVNTSGILTVTSAANGDQITNWSKLISAKEKLLDANVEGPFSAIMAPRTEAKFGGLQDTTNQPMQRPQFLDDVTFRSTTQIGVTDTQGTSTNATKVIVGDFSQLVFGIRSGLRVETLRERYADTMQLGFLAHLRADVQLEHAAAFVNVSGLIP